jgi:two-component system KDP operon response regulator KdpE
VESLPVVLIVEDDPNILKLLRYVLKKFPVRIAEAATIAQAREAVGRGSIAMALLDYMLPDGLSTELIKYLKAHTSARVIMVTARGEAEVRKECMGQGCDDYILKPFALKQIESSVQSLIGA